MQKPTKARSAASHAERKHNPLGEEYSPIAPLKQKTSKKRKQSHDEDGKQDAYVDSKASRRILDLGQDLAAEEEGERQSNKSNHTNDIFSFESRFPIASGDGDDGGVEAGEYDDEEAWGSDEEVEEVEVDPSDLETFNRFNPSFDPATLLQPKNETSNGEGHGGGTNLTELILEKLAAHEAAQEAMGEDWLPTHGGGGGGGGGGAEADDEAIELPTKVVEAYAHVGRLLSRYKSGKLPKPFKVLPTLPECDILLSITRPDSWSANAVYEATKLFSSSRPAIAQTFNTEVLLPRIREDMHENRKMNVHLYKAMQKALYKPAAFFRGLVFPLVESGTCTLREATIVSSVLAKSSIPVLHSASALYRLCDLAAEQMMHDVESAGGCNIFIRTLLEKKYALPLQVVDALVSHFLRFKHMQRGDDDISMSGTASGAKLPVLWHQCLLVFAQRYKDEFTDEQREALLDLVGAKGHKAIGPEVRRELLEGRGRGVVLQPGVGVGGDDTMIDV